MQNLMYGICTDPNLFGNLSFGQTMIFLTTDAFRAVRGLPERWSLSTQAWPFLNRLNHALIYVAPIALSPKFDAEFVQSS